LICLGLMPTPARGHAAQVFAAPPTLAQLARRADLVVVGEVTGTAGEWDAARTNIQTRVALMVAESLKGSAPATLTFTHLGGSVGGERSVVAGGPAFAAGQRVLVFLSRRPDGSLGLTDLVHGTWSIERDATTGRQYASRSTGAPGAERTELDQVRAEIRRALGEQG
jgi:hypothetical protein